MTAHSSIIRGPKSLELATLPLAHAQVSPGGPHVDAGEGVA